MAGRTLAVGDIHGSSAALDAVMAAVKPTPDDLFVFLGDYVDRGPDTKGVLDRLISWRDQLRVVCLRGNHELMMARARRDRDELRMWLGVGGTQALASYSTTGKAWLNDVPEEHWEFIETGLVDFYETDTHIFVHANLDPAVPLREQSELMLFWEFLTGPIRHESGKVVVCGHTAQRSGVPRAWRTTVCIDTNVYRDSGWLTCLDVRTGHYWQANNVGLKREGELQEEG